MTPASADNETRPPGGDGAHPGLAFYCVSDARFFLGAVGLINSLRLVGHSEPVFVLDCGLEDSQRELLSAQATLIPAPGQAPPLLLGSIAPLRRPAGVMVLIDADMVVTRPLAEPIEQASQGKVVAVEHGSDRFVPEWGELLGLGPVRRQTYVSGGLLVAGREPGEEVLRETVRLMDRVDFERTFWRRKELDYPFLYGDQDVLNAVLGARLPRDRLVALDRRLEAIPPFAGLKLLDATTLRCAYGDGTEPYVLHHLSVKPWLEATSPGIYTRLLKRLLGGGDLAIQVPSSQLPLHLRPGLLARVRRGPSSARHYLRAYARRLLLRR